MEPLAASPNGYAPRRSAPAHEQAAERVFALPRLGLLALSGVLGALAFPLAFPIGPRRELFASGILEPLAFLCLVPALIATAPLGWRKAFGAGLLAGMAFFTGAFWWVNVAMTTFGGMPNAASIPALSLLVAWCALHWGLAFALCSFFRDANGWPAGATIAPVWMATELLRNYLCSGFPWANLGYSQMRNLWFSQLGSAFGVYGIAFCVALVNGALFEVWRGAKGKRRFPVGLAACAAGVLVLGHAYGAFRVARWHRQLQQAPRIKVAVVQGNIDQKIKNNQRSHVAMVLGAYDPPTAEADDAGADLIVWPEASFPVPFPKGSLRIYPTALGRPHFRARLLLGVDVYDPLDLRHGNENAAYLVAPDLSVERQYTKYHLVPFGEYVLWDLDKLLPIQNLIPGSYLPGRDLSPLAVPTASGQPALLGVEICYDAIFPEISRTYAQRGANLLVNLTNDAWYGFSSAPFQFLRMVAMRAVETGLPVARAANTGISAFIDPLGRVLQPTALGLVNSDQDRVDPDLREPSQWRMQELPLSTGRTLYVVLGDIPAYLACLFCAAGGVLGAARGARKKKSARPADGRRDKNRRA